MADQQHHMYIYGVVIVPCNYHLCSHRNCNPCGSVNSELQTVDVHMMLLICHAEFPCVFSIIACRHRLCIYIWSYDNHLFTMHHSGYSNLVSLFFCTTIPTSGNIFYTCYTSFSWVSSSVHFCFEKIKKATL